MSHKLTMYENLRDMLEATLGKIESEKTLTKETLQEVHQACTSLEYIDEKIEDCKEKKWMEEHPEEETGASGRMYDRYSYDSMPRYSWRGRGRSSYEGNRTVNFYPRSGHDDMMYSRDSAKNKMVQKLSTLMDDTMSEEERMAIQDCINRINNR